MNEQYNYFGYWISLSTLEQWDYYAINSLIVKVLHEHKLEWSDFFALPTIRWAIDFELSPQQIETMTKCRDNIANNSFYAEDILSQGYRIIVLNSKEYSITAKKKLGRHYSPPILYAKGNLSLINTQTVTISGQTTSINFDVTKIANSTLIVSPNHLNHLSILERHLKNNGSGIILLPYGIKRYSDSYKRYYKNILSGKLLILSPFHPDSVENIESRQTQQMVIRGMADSIEMI